MTLVYAGILAGGGSTRMGRDKALLQLEGRSLLERTVAAVEAAALTAVVVGRDAPADWPHQRCRFLSDAHPGSGPLPAIIQLLRALPGEDVLVLSCDLPRLTPASVRFLLTAWSTPPAAPGVVAHGLVAMLAGQLEPLAAIYAASVLPQLEAAWQAGQRSVRRVLEQDPGVLRLPIPPELAPTFSDCDTPEEWRTLSGQDPASPTAG